MAFFEGGFSWETLANMPLDEFVAIVNEANRIDKDRRAAIERARNGK